MSNTLQFQHVSICESEKLAPGPWSWLVDSDQTGSGNGGETLGGGMESDQNDEAERFYLHEG